MVAPSLLRRSAQSARLARSDQSDQSAQAAQSDQSAQAAQSDQSAQAAQLTADGSAAGLSGWLTAFLLAAIRLYQQEISPRRRPCCRFSPTCSHYAAQALQSHGLRRGLWLTGRRLLRCRPGSAGGSDPVPPVR